MSNLAKIYCGIQEQIEIADVLEESFRDFKEKMPEYSKTCDDAILLSRLLKVKFHETMIIVLHYNDLQ